MRRISGDHWLDLGPPRAELTFEADGEWRFGTSHLLPHKIKFLKCLLLCDVIILCIVGVVPRQSLPSSGALYKKIAPEPHDYCRLRFDSLLQHARVEITSERCSYLRARNEVR